MRRLLAFVGAVALAAALSIPASAAAPSATFQQAAVDAGHPFGVFVHTATDGTLGAKASWVGAHYSTLTLTLTLVDQPTPDYIEIDNHGESCSIAGIKPLTCYVGAPQFTKGGFAPSGWYRVKVEEFEATQAESNLRVSVYGDIDQIVQ